MCKASIGIISVALTSLGCIVIDPSAKRSLLLTPQIVIFPTKGEVEVKASVLGERKARRNVPLLYACRGSRKGFRRSFEPTSTTKRLRLMGTSRLGCLDHNQCQSPEPNPSDRHSQCQRKAEESPDRTLGACLAPFLLGNIWRYDCEGPSIMVPSQGMTQACKKKFDIFVGFLGLEKRCTAPASRRAGAKRRIDPTAIWLRATPQAACNCGKERLKPQAFLLREWQRNGSYRRDRDNAEGRNDTPVVAIFPGLIARLPRPHLFNRYIRAKQ
ncbi:hypothetical protein K438DRAFT_1782626 [Mycena galopus ATCC 62051]|nr:hypothetical protein K438DRAFT_1782626 [Mycena galopus ATCC 62051]